MFGLGTSRRAVKPGLSRNLTTECAANIEAARRWLLVLTDLRSAEILTFVHHFWHALEVTFANQARRLNKLLGVDWEAGDAHLLPVPIRARRRLDIDGCPRSYMQPSRLGLRRHKCKAFTISCPLAPRQPQVTHPHERILRILALHGWELAAVAPEQNSYRLRHCECWRHSTASRTMRRLFRRPRLRS